MLLSEVQCLLVKGWKSSAGWGFPKGKINQLEELHMCAIREVRPIDDYALFVYLLLSTII